MRDAAIIGYVQGPQRRYAGAANESEMVMPVVRDVMAQVGVTQKDIGFTCSGSCDYLPGAAFAFVEGARRVGACAADQRVARRDGRRLGALRGLGEDLQTGEVDTALVYGFGKSSPGDLRDVLALQLDPYYLAPLWPDSSASRRCRPARCSTRRAPASATWPRWWRAAAPTRSPTRTRSSRATSDRGAAGRAVPSSRRCAGTTARRSPTAPRRWSSPPATWPRVLQAPGLDPRHRSPHRDRHPRRARPHALALDADRRREGRRRARARSTSPSCTRRSPTRSSSCAASSGWRRRAVNPSGGALARQHDDGGGPGSASASGRADHRVARPIAAWRTRPGALPAAEPGRGPGGMSMANRVAVVGIGQTKHTPSATTSRWPAWCARRAERALEDAGCDWRDIDAVVIGKAPDMFEGVMMPELYLADALGGTGKPMIRVHTAGSVGGSTAIVAASYVQPARYERVLTVAFEKQSESNAMWALSPRMPFVPLVTRARAATSRRTCAVHAAVRGAGPHRRMVAVKDRLNALQEPVRAPADPEHRPRDGAAVADAVGPDPLPRDLPVVGRRLRDGARERGARAARAEQAGVDPRHRHAHRADHVRRQRPGQPAGADRLRQGRLRQGRHHQPAQGDRRGRDLRAVQLVRADVAGEPRLLRARARAGSSPRPAPPRSTATSRSTPRAACCRRTRSARRA